ncbi:MAG TPA: AAA family ATPase, partial [Planctomycetota bacterium]|nr:AAA family ATPase [Planctomycetota bacterium]
MTRKFGRGLIVGKFSPLHRGHEAIIATALESCDEVCLVSYANPELPGCDVARREQWVSELFPKVRHLALGPREVPPDDEDATTHRRFCGSLCLRKLGGPVDAVFTGEDYGDAFAAELTRYFREHGTYAGSVVHVRVDRAAAAISGTLLRRDIHGRRDWLSPAVYASFVRRVCLLGGESTGKSTLAKTLAREFNTVHAAEYGRELWELKGGMLDFDDLERIGRTQVEREESAARTAFRFLFCDSSPLTTLFYSRHLFGRATRDLERLAERPYDVTILCAPDFPFVQDGTRQPEAFRTHQHEWYVEELT